MAVGQRSDSRRRLLIIGLPGADWDLLNSWRRWGVMPVLDSLVQRASWGQTRAFLPTYESPNHASFWTGVSPGLHTIFCTAAVGDQGVVRRNVTASDLRYPTWLQILSDHGKEVVSIHGRLTHPASPVRGRIISRHGTYPPELADKLKYSRSNIEAPQFPADGIKDPKDLAAFVRVHIRGLGHIGDLAMELIAVRQFDAALINFVPLDRLLHPLWDLTEGQDTADPTLREIAGELDRQIGRVIKASESDAVLLFSTHGMTRCYKILNLAPALCERGVLELPAVSRRSHPLGSACRIVRGIARHLHRRLGLPSLSSQVVSQPWQVVDDPHSRVYLDDKAVYIHSTGEATLLGTRIRTALETIRDSETGLQPIKKIWPARELYGAVALVGCEVLIIEHTTGYTSRVGDINGPLFESQIPRRDYLIGTHTRTGMWLMSGKAVKIGAEKDICVANLAPAILGYLDVPVPQWMQSRNLVLPLDSIIGNG